MAIMISTLKHESRNLDTQTKSVSLKVTGDTDVMDYYFKTFFHMVYQCRKKKTNMIGQPMCQDSSSIDTSAINAYNVINC